MELKIFEPPIVSESNRAARRAMCVAQAHLTIKQVDEMFREAVIRWHEDKGIKTLMEYFEEVIEQLREEAEDRKVNPDQIPLKEWWGE